MKRILMTAMLFATCICFAAPSAAADGEALYKTKCLMCHGALGKGTAMGPAFKDSEYVRSSSDQMIAEVILKGRDGDAKKHKNIALGMPAQKLSDGDVSALIAYLKSLAGTAAATAARINGENGKDIYGKYCARCHGEDGSGSQYGLALQPKPTRDLRTNKLFFSDNELLIIINHGGAWREMPSWEYVLTDAEVKDAAGYVRTLNYTPDRKDGERLFKEKCALCHATDGFMKKTWQAPDLDKSSMGSSEMARIVRYGIHSTLMYPRETVRTNAEISNLVEYIQSLKK